MISQWGAKHVIGVVSAASAIIAVAMTDLAARAQENNWYPSRYGADDEIGAANNLSPAGVVKAAQLVKTGKVYSLAIETGPTTPMSEARQFGMLVMAMTPTGRPMGKNQVTANDDFLASSLGLGTQLDGFGHIGINYRHYNGVPFEKFYHPKGIRKFGTEKIPPIVTRGVLLDIAALKNIPLLQAGTAITRADLLAAMKRQHVTVAKGDVVLIHTGWMAVAEADPKKFMSAEPGLNAEAAQFLIDQGVVAIGSDNHSLEVMPFENKDDPLPVHQLLLPKNGVYILEFVKTKELAADEVSEFLFVLGQPKFVGAVQMVVNPIAIH